VSFPDKLLRVVLTTGHQLLKAGWFIRRPRTFGAHAIALTPERRLVLVKLRYAPGWRLPGGGCRADEDPRGAVLRELREEIGMTSHGAVRLACELEQATDFKLDLAALLVVEDVRYQPPRWSWEVERVMEYEPDDLPLDLAPITQSWIAAIRDRL
jgi:8-oxo-dGTP pyrophosphatase MutT (NUDIX family)